MNSYGKELLDLCVSAELCIVNGRVGVDRDRGNYTCHTCRGNSVVDCKIVLTDLLENIRGFQVKYITIHSDHCPLSFQISTALGSIFHLAQCWLCSSELFKQWNRASGDFHDIMMDHGTRGEKYTWVYLTDNCHFYSIAKLVIALHGLNSQSKKVAKEASWEN